jgi:hypothetical protein
MDTPKLSTRLLWFIGLWLAGVLSVSILGFAINLLLR